MGPGGGWGGGPGGGAGWGRMGEGNWEGREEWWGAQKKVGRGGERKDDRG